MFVTSQPDLDVSAAAACPCFLLADEVGAGSPMTTGRCITYKMPTPHLIWRMLIVSSADLVTTWQRERHTCFSLSFHIVTGSDAHTKNPFHNPDSDHLIVSVDKLAGERVFARLQEPSAMPYDLVIFELEISEGAQC